MTALPTLFLSLPPVDKATGKPIPGSKAALVYGQMNEPPGARARVALTGLAIAGKRSILQHPRVYISDAELHEVDDHAL